MDDAEIKGWFRYSCKVVGRAFHQLTDEEQSLANLCLAKAIRAFDPTRRGSFKTLLLHVLWYAIKTEYRKRRRQFIPMVSLTPEIWQQIADKRSLLDAMSAEETKEVEELIDRLLVGRQNVFARMAWLAGLSEVDIANQCGITHQAVNQHLKKARKRLQKWGSSEWAEKQGHFVDERPSCTYNGEELKPLTEECLL
jgi:RNA polymerase sigma factor (sigma-70 family)